MTVSLAIPTDSGVWRERRKLLEESLNSAPIRKYAKRRIKEVIAVFLARQTLRLDLTDEYFVKVLEESPRTVQRTFQLMEELGLLVRRTYPPRQYKKGNFTHFRQLRHLFLKIPKSSTSMGRQKLPLGNLKSRQDGNKNPSSTVLTDKREGIESLSFKKNFRELTPEEYLARCDSVPERSWFYWCRNIWKADPKRFGLLSNIYKKIQNRPDLLEEVLFCARKEKIRLEKMMGYIVHGIRIRLGLVTTKQQAVKSEKQEKSVDERKKDREATFRQLRTFDEKVQEPIVAKTEKTKERTEKLLERLRNWEAEKERDEKTEVETKNAPEPIQMNRAGAFARLAENLQGSSTTVKLNFPTFGNGVVMPKCGS
jgi:hypothetical protein